MDAAGLDSTEARKKVRAWQATQRDFVEQTGLRRDYFRERAGKQFGSLPLPSMISHPDITIARSLGAKAKNYDIYDPETGLTRHLVEGTRVRGVEVFAGYGTKTPLHEGVAEGLTDEFGGEINRWQHAKGYGTILLEEHDEQIDAELHWFQEPSAGKVKWKIKRKIW